MKRISHCLCLLVAASIQGFADVSGTVVDRAGNGIAGVMVSLADSCCGPVTDAKGAWSLGTSGALHRQSTGSDIRWNGSAIELNLATAAWVAFDVHGIDGALLRSSPGSHLHAGVHLLEVGARRSGMARVRVTVDGRSELLLVGRGTGSSNLASHARGASASKAERGFAGIDTLRFFRKGYRVALVPLRNRDTSGIVVMIGTDSTVPWNESVSHGYRYDVRDGQAYRTVQVGGQEWMAENLNYKAGICYDYKNEKCFLYGRLYRWSTVMTEIVGGLCGEGWHAPSDSEWTTLIKTVESDPRVGKDKAAKALTSTKGWDKDVGTDLFGFRGLPAGGFYSYAVFYNGGYTSDWWSTTAYDSTLAMSRNLSTNFAFVNHGMLDKLSWHSVRCLRD